MRVQHSHRWTLMRIGLAGWLVTCSSEPERAAQVYAASGLPQTVLINEVEADPPGTDDRYQYVELLGPAQAKLAAHSLVALEADLSSGNPGAVDWTADLQSTCDGGVCALGHNGLFMLTAPDGHSAMDAETVVAQSPVLEGGGLENGSLVLLLVRSVAPWNNTQDWDTDDDCVLDLPTGVQLLDAVGWLDGDPGDCTYVATLLTPERPSAASRFDKETCTSCTEAWFAGTLAGPADTLAYATGLQLTPGGPNPERPGFGSSGSAGTAARARAASTAQDPTGDALIGGQAGSGGADSPTDTEMGTAMAGAAHWSSPPVVVALHSTDAGAAGFLAATELGADGRMPDNCGCRGSGLQARPVAGWWWISVVCWAAGARLCRFGVRRGCVLRGYWLQTRWTGSRSMSNRAIWNVRQRHEWLRKPLNGKNLKRRKRWRIGLQQALDRKASAASPESPQV